MSGVQVVQNPNWPLLRVLWSPTTNAVYDSNPALYTDITLRCLDQWIVRRGRQYELDLMQPGKFQSTVNNRDGALNPISTQSVFAPGVLPERSVKVLAQWPPTQQLLTADIATAGDASGTAPGAIPASWQASATYAVPVIAASSSAWQGGQVFETPCGDGDLPGGDLLRVSNQPIIAPTLLYPALDYTWSVYVRSNTTGANPVVAAAITWKNAAAGAISTVTASNVTLTGSATDGWERLTIAAAPPAGAVALDLVVQLTEAGPSTAWNFQADGLQLEQASAASAWTQPEWYPIFAGNVTRYPNNYDLSGTRGIVKMQATDALGLLSRSVITASLAGLIANPAGDNSLSGAVFDYTLGDATTSYADALGLRAAAGGIAGKNGLGTITPGVAVTSTTAGQAFLGTTQTCVSCTAPGGAGGGSTAAMSAISLPAGPNGKLGPGSGAGVGYTRMIAFKCTSAPTANSSVLWSARAVGAYAQGVSLMPGGTVAAIVNDAAHSGTSTIGTYDVGNWHLAWLGVAADGSSFLAGVDGTVTITSAGATDYVFPNGFAGDLLGAQSASASVLNWLQDNFVGDLALFVEWPELLTTSAIAAIYAAWRTGFTGDSTGQRAARILNWAKYVGATAIDTGSTLSLGAATDVDETDAVTALQAVVSTEGGEHFAARDGTYTLYGRARRLGATAPAFTFGTDVAGGEIPFEDVQFDFDDTQVSNDVANSQVSTLATYYAVNESSAETFGTSTLTLSNQSRSAQGVIDQANWYAGVNGYPRLRVASLTLHPSANPAVLWPVCLALELGLYVQVNQRPMGATVGAIDPVTMTGYVENVQITGKGADARWVLQISADVASGGGPSQAAAHPWNLALLHTTLTQPATAGTNTITIDALPTAATSTLAQNLPQGGPGFQLTIGDGLTTEESLTIESVSTTVVGYSTATITFTTPLAHDHAAHEVVRESLGGASATTWQNLDAYSTLGTCMIAY